MSNSLAGPAGTMVAARRAERPNDEMKLRDEACEHARDIEQVTARATGCEEGLKLGARWTELRVCLSCGHVGCCEDSTHAHALAHFNATRHPIIAPLDARETWAWCYVDRCYFALPSHLQPKKRSRLRAAVARLVRKS